MNGSIYAGKSALLSFQKALDVESNNISNVNTVGYKSDIISFSDLMYQGGIGKGVTMNDPVKDFGQGGLKMTGLDYDFAINGEGFFTVVDPQDGSTYYTRAGNFRKDANSDMVDINEMHIMGILPVISGDKITEEYSQSIGSSVVEDDNTIISLNIFSTNYKKTAVDTGISGTNYKTSSSNIDDIEALRTAYQSAILAYEKNIVPGDVASSRADSVTYPTSVDDQGNYRPEITINGIKYQQEFENSVGKTLQLLSDKINKTAGITSKVDITTGVLTIESMIPGAKMGTTNAKITNNNLAVNTISKESGSGQNLIDAIYTQMQTVMNANGAKLATAKSEISKTPTGTPPTLGKISLDLDALGLSSNLVGELKNDNGDIYLEQGDAKFLVAKLAPVLFQYSSSLRPEGHNLYSATSESGQPLFVSEKAEIINGYVEVSSTDLSESLVNLMVWQKAYEANSKTVTTSDDLLKTALALKTK